MSEPSTRLLLVRHAQADQAAADGGLTELGATQASAVRDALRVEQRDLVVASPLRRARETAAVLRSDAEVLDTLQEFDFGPAAPELREMTAGRTDLTIWRPDHGFPGGETLRAFKTRVAGTLEALVRDNPGRRVVAVTHAGVLDAAIRWGYGLSPEDDWLAEASLPNASVTELEHWRHGRSPGGAPRFTLVHRVGDVSHLAAGHVTDF